ncbi:hypothetical protein FACS189472_17080 [Alphaproteobacteria bacterium]|nr:hypothetical protein FACS189472_17080 [Alphaproteobacteria bacterium]
MAAADECENVTKGGGAVVSLATASDGVDEERAMCRAVEGRGAVLTQKMGLVREGSRKKERTLSFETEAEKKGLGLATAKGSAGVGD